MMDGTDRVHQTRPLQPFTVGIWNQNFKLYDISALPKPSEVKVRANGEMKTTTSSTSHVQVPVLSSSS
jgi:hypothetical protein